MEIVLVRHGETNWNLEDALWARKIRDVDLAKGNFRFAPAIYLNDTLKTIDNLLGNNYDEI